MANGREGACLQGTIKTIGQSSVGRARPANGCPSEAVGGGANRGARGGRGPRKGHVTAGAPQPGVNPPTTRVE